MHSATVNTTFVSHKKPKLKAMQVETISQETTFTCSVCCQIKDKPKDSCSTGYGYDKDNNKICFECCGKQDEKELRELAIGSKTSMYLTIVKDGEISKLSNWPGSFTIPIHYVRKGRHNKAGRRYDVWFKFSDNYYHGTQFGDNTQICHITRLKHSF